jgi:phage terminase small subunit
MFSAIATSGGEPRTLTNKEKHEDRQERHCDRHVNQSREWISCPKKLNTTAEAFWERLR